MAAALPERLIVVAGPTAAGKSGLAAHLAAALGGVVIGADSRQVYRYMDAGTAKPEPELLALAPHELIDVVDPDAAFDASIWRALAVDALAAAHAEGRPVVVCGGTGLYIRSLIHGLFEGPEADPALRAELESAEDAAPGTLTKKLWAVDPEAAERIHENDRVRLVRALEVYELSGKPISEWQRGHAALPPLFDTLTLQVSLDRRLLYERIDRRAEAMVDAGLLEELAGLRSRGYAPDLRAFAAIGYREAGECLDGELAASDLAAAVAQSTRRYAKRQLVWIKGQMDAVPVAPTEQARAQSLAEAFLGAVATRDSDG